MRRGFDPSRVAAGVVPDVPATLQKDGRTLVVNCCPFCLGRHLYGHASYGLRTAHCLTDHPHGRSYRLVPALEVSA